jgi:hypothetical protein
MAKKPAYHDLAFKPPILGTEEWERMCGTKSSWMTTIHKAGMNTYFFQAPPSPVREYTFSMQTLPARATALIAAYASPVPWLYYSETLRALDKACTSHLLFSQNVYCMWCEHTAMKLGTTSGAAWALWSAKDSHGVCPWRLLASHNALVVPMAPLEAHMRAVVAAHRTWWCVVQTPVKKREVWLLSTRPMAIQTCFTTRGVVCKTTDKLCGQPIAVKQERKLLMLYTLDGLCERLGAVLELAAPV